MNQLLPLEPLISLCHYPLLLSYYFFQLPTNRVLKKTQNKQISQCMNKGKNFQKMLAPLLPPPAEIY